MREIKFKVWDKVVGRWNEDGEDYTEEHIVYAWDTEGTSLSTLIQFISRPQGKEGKERYILLQYTGLKDKNGKEIYEGDIVKWEEENDLYGNTIKIKEKVYLDDGQFIPFNEIRGYLVEVIGNIYENPDLLK